MSGTLFCIVAILYMLFGVLFYELRVFTYVDEVVAIAIAIYASWQIFTRRVPLNKPFIIWIAISFFYLIYSFVIKSNVPAAIVSDFIMQSKPYLVFFGLMCVKPKLERRHFNILQIACWLFICLVILIYIHHPEDRIVATTGVLLTGEALSAVSILIGALFYLSSDSNSFWTKVCTILIMSVGVLSPTSKFWGILITAIAILFFINKPIKISLKYILIACAALVVIFFLVKDEFYFYFIEDFEYNTRPMLYLTMWDVLADYIPCGSGFATYANPASMTWYSPIYTKYNLDTIWGLDEGNQYHFAADAYYPIFAQFGYLGMALFVCFFIYIFKRMNNLYHLTEDIKRYKVALLIIAYILIQATSNSLANERCIIAMTILVLSLYQYRKTTKVSALNSFGLDFAGHSFNTQSNEGTTDK